jgi:hypothetical protein
MLIKYFVRNINIINIFLLSLAFFFSLYILFPEFDTQIRYALPKPKKSPVFTEKKYPEIQTPSIAEYMAVSEENLFHPERKIPVEKKAEKPLPKPDFVLFGTLITDTMSIAYLEDIKAPRSTAGRGKRQTALRKGDTLSGFTVKEIHPGEVIMVRGNDEVVVEMHDTTERGSPESTAVSQAEPTQRKPRVSPRNPRAIPRLPRR